MIVFTLDTDARGWPIIDLFVAPSTPRLEALTASGVPAPSPTYAKAMLDTGASCTVVERSIIDRLGLEPVGEETMHTPSSEGVPKIVEAYAAQLLFAGVSDGLLAADLRVIEVEDLTALGVHVLLGRDVLARALLIFNGPEGRFTVAFSPAES